MTTRSTLPSARPTRLTWRLSAALVVAPALLAGVLLAPRAGSAAEASLSTVRLAAGHRVVDRSGHVWTSDAGYVTGGTVTRTAHRISATANQALYRSARVGRLAYRIPVTPGWYRVTIGTAEQVFAQSDRRIYTLIAEGTTRAAQVTANPQGRFHADTVTLDVRVSDGALDLAMTPRRHAAAVSIIEVIGLRRWPRPTPAPSTVASPAPSAPGSSTPTSSPPVSSTPVAGTPVAGTPVAGTPAPAGSVTPDQFGAVGDGVTDDTAALQRTFDGAAGRTVVLPAGRVYAHADLLHLRTAGLHVSGPGELLATNEQRSSVWIEADDVLLDGGLLVETGSTTQRWGAWEQMGVRLIGHTGITLRNVTVDGSAAAGIYVGGAAHGFVLDHVTVRDTRADGIHLTDGSYQGTVSSPTVINSGDDGVAVVSYKQDGAPCHDITVTSPRVLGTTGGRGLSVVGGTTITETDIDVERTSAAAVYVGSEGSPWYTAAATNVVITGGTVVDANTDTTVDHGAVVVLSGESDVTPATITVRGLRVVDTRATASRDLGVITYGTTPSGILFSDITITGGPAAAYQGNTAQSAYQLRGIVQNGARLPDAG